MLAMLINLCFNDDAQLESAIEQNDHVVHNVIRQGIRDAFDGLPLDREQHRLVKELNGGTIEQSERRKRIVERLEAIRHALRCAVDVAKNKLKK